MEEDAIINEIGGFGLFQTILVTIIFLSKVPLAFGLAFMSFGNYNPGWRCADDTHLNTTLWGDALSMSLNASIENVTEQGYSKDCAIVKTCNHLEFSKESSTIATEWSLVCDRDWISSLIISIQNAGGLLGAIVTGQVSDLFGRKLGLYSNMVISAVVNLIAVFSNSWEMFAVIRFFIGFCTAGMLVTSCPYPLEFVSNKWRPILMAIPDWSTGASIFALTAWILKDWRHLHVVTSVASVLHFLTVFWMPESVRWLATKGKVTQAKRITKRICKINKRPSPDTDFIDRTAEEGCKADAKNSKYTYLSLLSKTLRIRSIACFTILFIMAFVYFPIGFGVKALSGNFYLNLFLFNLVVIPAVIPMPIIANKIGRKQAIIFFTFLGSCLSFSLVAVYFLASTSAKGPTTTALAILTSVCIDVAWSAMDIPLGEVFPTVLRSLGVGVAYTGARFGSILGPYLIPEDFDDLYVCFSIVGVLLLVCCGLVLLLPETKQKGLEDTFIAGSQTIEMVNENGEKEDNVDDNSNTPKPAASQVLLPIC